MNNKVIAKDKTHLKKIIAKEIQLNGNNCDLNHIDVSELTDLSYLFAYELKDFNGNISKWNVSKVQYMNYLFEFSLFNGNISEWNPLSVIDMQHIFSNSKFSGETSDWKPIVLQSVYNMFVNCPAPIPYWALIEDIDKRNIAIINYCLKNELNGTLIVHGNFTKKIKI